MYISYDELLGLEFVWGIFWPILKLMMFFPNSFCGVMSHVILYAHRTNWKKLLSF